MLVQRRPMRRFHLGSDETASCIMCRTQLRVKFKTDGQFYRVFPNGEVGS